MTFYMVYTIGTVSYRRWSAIILDSSWLSFYSSVRTTDRVCILLFTVTEVYINILSVVINAYILCFAYFLLDSEECEDSIGVSAFLYFFLLMQLCILEIHWLGVHLVTLSFILVKIIDKGKVLDGKVQRRTNCDLITGKHAWILMVDFSGLS